MDMWEAYINAVTEVIEGAEQLICFDPFHVAADFGKAVDKVRAAKHHVVARMVRRYLWGDHQRDHTSRNERERRIDQCENSEDQGNGLRLPQQGTIPNRDPVSQGWSVSASRARLKRSLSLIEAAMFFMLRSSDASEPALLPVICGSTPSRDPRWYWHLEDSCESLHSPHPVRECGENE